MARDDDDDKHPGARTTSSSSSRSTSHASASQRAGGSSYSGGGFGMGSPPGGMGSGGPGYGGGGFSGFGGGGGRDSGAGYGGLPGSLGGLMGGGYGNYGGPSRYGPPGQSTQGFRSLVNAVNAIGGTPAERVAGVLSNMGYRNPFGLAGMLGTFDYESAGFNPNAIGDKNLKNKAYGLAQWREGRVDRLNDYAKQMGLDPNDLATQAAFAGVELKTDPAYRSAYEGVMNANSVADAVAAMNAYERPAGYKPGGTPAKVAGWSERLSRAQKYLPGSGIAPGASAPLPTTASLLQPASMSYPSAVPSAPSTYSETGPSLWQQGKDLAKAGWNAFTEGNKKINSVPGGAKTVMAMTRQDGPGKFGPAHPGEGGRNYSPEQNRHFESKLVEYVKKRQHGKDKKDGKDKGKKKTFVFKTPKTVFPRYSQASWLKNLRFS